MGIESDKLVYDYLSRVGDLAQTAMPSSDRMRLVAQLRGDIDRQRAGSDSEAAVRRILGKLGTPDEVVESAARRTPDRSSAPAPAPVPQPDPALPRPGEPPTPPRGAVGPPTLDKTPDDRGPSAAEPQWWRVSPAPGREDGGGIRGGLTTNDILAGWSGGLLPPEPDEQDEGDEGDEEPEAEEADAPVEATAPRRFRLRRSSTPAPAAADGAVRRGLPVGPLELLAALALVAGVVLGNWLALGTGWLLAYTTRGIGRGEAKFAALGLPGLVAAADLVWLWGRTEGRWGTPLPTAQLGQTISADFPAVVKTAAIGSALFLLWRSSRHRA